mgnify:CR=1 FL=1
MRKVSICNWPCAELQRVPDRDPQRKQQADHRKLLASLQKGDQVVTSGGIIGEVIHLKDAEVTIKSGESRLVVMRTNVANILNRGTAVEAKQA